MSHGETLGRYQGLSGAATAAAAAATEVWSLKSGVGSLLPGECT